MSALTTASSSRQLVVSTVEVAKPTPTSTPPSHTSKLASSKTSERPSPGQWRHPKFDEIAQRKTASSFSQADMARIFWNTAALILAAIFYRKCFDLIRALGVPYHSKLDWLLRILLYTIPLFNIGRGIVPLFFTPDNLNNVDLSPTQRSLLGLDPSATPPATPSTHYSTPPRYPRSATPRSSASRGSSGAWSFGATAASSAGSRLDSPWGARSRTGSPWAAGSLVLDGSPAPSPLWNKGLNHGERRRHSYALSPLPPRPGTPEGGSVFAPNTPSPTGPTEKGSVPFSSRWIYNQGSRSGKRSSLTGF